VKFPKAKIVGSGLGCQCQLCGGSIWLFLEVGLTFVFED